MTNRTPGLIAIDIDGCLFPAPTITLDSALLLRLCRLVGGLPVLLCSGRAQPYVEAVARILDLSLPCICEWGGILYTPRPYTIEIHSSVTPVLLDGIANLTRPFLARGCTVQPKFTALTVYADTRWPVEDLGRLVNERAAALGLSPELHINIAPDHVDARPRCVDKGKALSVVAQRMQVALADVLVIGDDLADVPMFDVAGWRAAPANAHPQILVAANLRTTAVCMAAVCDILDRVLAEGLAGSASTAREGPNA